MENSLIKARELINETDRQMAKLFEQRMNAVKEIARYKKENGLPITDHERERALLVKNSSFIKSSELSPYYSDFLGGIIKISKAYQTHLINETDNDPFLHINGCDILVKSGAVKRANELFCLNRKVLLVTDSGVPAQYVSTVAEQCKKAVIVTLKQGEESKSLENLETLLHTLLINGFTRSDCAVSVGGGMVSDLTGFACSSYMRGIDFYNIPTTLLSQIDASIGGKTAINFCGVKNAVGAFYQPRAVIIDPEVLKTLSKSQFANGMAELIKTAVIMDERLFCRLEELPAFTVDEDIIKACAALKCEIVARDERENGLRRILNFGHTVGHAVEAVTHCAHGEAVAAGMCVMCSDKVKNRLIPLLKKYDLPTKITVNGNEIIKAVIHDKKVSGDQITVVFCHELGSCQTRQMPLTDFERLLRNREG